MQNYALPAGFPELEDDVATLKDRLKKKDSKKDKTRPLAPVHVVQRGGLARAKRGENVTALCGVKMEGTPAPANSPICQGCVMAQFREDDTKADQRVTEARQQGERTGEDRGRATTMTEIRQQAERRAAEEQAEAERVKYSIRGDQIRMKLDDGGTATLRTSQISSVRLVQDAQSNQWHLLIDGDVAYAHEDEAKVREHHDTVHEAVFGQATLAS